VGIILQNVGIFEENFGGDKWGFLIAEMGILTQKILEALQASDAMFDFSCVTQVEFPASREFYEF